MRQVFIDMKKAVALLMCAVILTGLCSCAAPQEQTTNLTAMNTLMQIRVFSSLCDGTEAVTLLENEIRRLENLFDANASESDVYRINSCEKECEISRDTAEIIKISKAAFEKTDGAFDITVMPVLRLWGFDNGNYGVPKKKNLKSALALVGSDRIALDGTTLKKEKGTQISLGGVAKGYLGDRLLEIAKENGICGIVSLGGNIVLCGENEEKGFWSVGVKDPDNNSEIVCSFECGGNLSVVTSGAYERYFEFEGKAYHHIIDPETGKPAESDLKSVTVIGKNGALCDAYSTSLFVMGKNKAVEFIKENNDFEYVLITADNEIICSDGVKNPTSDLKINKLSDDAV